MGKKNIDIPVGNLILLRDHPEGRCKIQDWNKSELFKVIRKGERPNNFWITPAGSKGLPKQVNWRQLFDTGTSEEGLAGERRLKRRRRNKDQPFLTTT